MYYEIKTNRLLLRPLSLKDLETVYKYSSDEENSTFMIWLPHDTKEKTIQFLTRVTEEWSKENPDFYEFAIILNETQIGAVSVALNKDKSEGELGWIVNKKYWKKGYALEAAAAVKDFAINELGVTKLTANCDHRNTNSFTVSLLLGYVLVPSLLSNVRPNFS